MSAAVGLDDATLATMQKLAEGTHKLILVPVDDEQRDTDLRDAIDRHIVVSRSWGSTISTEDARQRWGREQGLQDLRADLFGERLPK
jgi:hypothetical protein